MEIFEIMENISPKQIGQSYKKQKLTYTSNISLEKTGQNTASEKRDTSKLDQRPPLKHITLSPLMVAKDDLENINQLRQTDENKAAFMVYLLLNPDFYNDKEIVSLISTEYKFMFLSKLPQEREERFITHLNCILRPLDLNIKQVIMQTFKDAMILGDANLRI